MPKMMIVTRITAGRRRQIYVAIAVSRATRRLRVVFERGLAAIGAVSDVVILSICQAINPQRVNRANFL
jgi:propanediol dehydratase small subunit